MSCALARDFYVYHTKGVNNYVQNARFCDIYTKINSQLLQIEHKKIIEKRNEI